MGAPLSAGFFFLAFFLDLSSALSLFLIELSSARSSSVFASPPDFESFAWTAKAFVGVQLGPLRPASACVANSADRPSAENTPKHGNLKPFGEIMRFLQERECAHRAEQSNRFFLPQRMLISRAIVIPAIWICNIFLPDCCKFDFGAGVRDVTSAQSFAKKGAH